MVFPVFFFLWFFSHQVWMWELDHKESWVPKNWCFRTVVLEKTLESPLDCKEIQSVHPKGNQSWIFIGRTDAEAEAPILWPPDVKSWLIWKDPEAGKDWRQEEKGATEDKMVWWHHWLIGHEFEQTPGDSEGQESLVCCSPWGHKESDMTERLKNNKVILMLLFGGALSKKLWSRPRQFHRHIPTSASVSSLWTRALLIWISGLQVGGIYTPQSMPADEFQARGNKPRHCWPLSLCHCYDGGGDMVNGNIRTDRRHAVSSTAKMMRT